MVIHYDESQLTSTKQVLNYFNLVGERYCFFTDSVRSGVCINFRTVG